VFFIQKRYSEEVEKNNKHKNKEPSIARMTFLGLMATFTPTRWLLRMHKRKVEDSSTTESNFYNYANANFLRTWFSRRRLYN
jgi:hypothetical protein